MRQFDRLELSEQRLHLQRAITTETAAVMIGNFNLTPQSHPNHVFQCVR